MPESKQQVRYQWILPIIDGKMSIKDLVSVCPFSERAVKYWLLRYKENGYSGLLDKSTRPISSPNKLPEWKRSETTEAKYPHL